MPEKIKEHMDIFIEEFNSRLENMSEQIQSIWNRTNSLDDKTAVIHSHVKKVEETCYSNCHHISNLFQGTRAGLDMLLSNFDGLKERVKRLENENDHHCGAITALEHWKDDLMRDSKLYTEPLQYQVWQDNMIKRLEKLESEFAKVGYRMGIAQWKNIEEEAPEKDGRYIVYVPNYNWVSVSSLRNGVFDDSTASHWMNLPDLPL